MAVSIPILSDQGFKLSLCTISLRLLSNLCFVLFCNSTSLCRDILPGAGREQLGKGGPCREEATESHTAGTTTSAFST